MARCTTTTDQPRVKRRSRSHSDRLRKVCGSGETCPGSCVATFQRATLVLGQATPHAGVLATLERPRKALRHDRAAAANRLGLLDLHERRPGVPNREEKLRVFVTADRAVTPIHWLISSLGRSGAASSMLHLRL